MRALWETKTFWTGAAAVLAALGAWVTGEADAFAAGQMALSGLAAICLRHGLITQAGPAAPAADVRRG